MKASGQCFWKLQYSQFHFTGCHSRMHTRVMGADWMAIKEGIFFLKLSVMKDWINYSDNIFCKQKFWFKNKGCVWGGEYIAAGAIKCSAIRYMVFPPPPSSPTAMRYMPHGHFMHIIDACCMLPLLCSTVRKASA